MPSLLWSVRSALVTSFAAPAAAAGADLYDGPRRRGDTPKLFLVVGADSDDPFTAADADFEDTLTGTSRQEWSPEGPGTWREETGSVLCTAVAWSGDDDFAPLRAQVEALVDVLEATLLANRQLGGSVGAGVELGELRVWERRSTQGSAVGAVLEISYQSTLT